MSTSINDQQVIVSPHAKYDKQKESNFCRKMFFLQLAQAIKIYPIPVINTG